MRPLGLILILAIGFLQPAVPLLAAEAPTAPLPPPTTEQRLADLEAYINNTARATDGQAVSKDSPEAVPATAPG
jgi:hypothetical protein